MPSSDVLTEISITRWYLCHLILLLKMCTDSNKDYYYKKTTISSGLGLILSRTSMFWTAPFYSGQTEMNDKPKWTYSNLTILLYDWNVNVANYTICWSVNKVFIFIFKENLKLIFRVVIVSQSDLNHGTYIGHLI